MHATPSVVIIKFSDDFSIDSGHTNFEWDYPDSSGDELSVVFTQGGRRVTTLIALTANKLYDLARIGNMGTPLDVLALLWQGLSDKMRVMIAHTGSRTRTGSPRTPSTDSGQFRAAHSALFAANGSGRNYASQADVAREERAGGRRAA
ncbi:hypothetical protein P3W85_19835 [Cupriavidus basilensis]|uniref:Uncharacterized protein n=1 Tax=Cupriavidus basilensis TaxID=68895 RepID=A0ABT6ARH3_9BURK|nr:hypothetical protein [Cupriavidus basilensis]MDF3835195.1 hypothetical protein [Cupriavidus basilensis]